MKIDFTNTALNFIISLAIRSFIGLYLIRGIHKPDQLFQGPQVSHNLVYGKGYLSWQWLIQYPIRNPVFPYIFAIPYYILNYLGLDHHFTLFIMAPKILQAFIGAGFDTMLIKINRYYNGEGNFVNFFVIFLNYTNYASLTYLSRTYVNGIQALLTIIAFYYWLHRNQNNKNDLISRLIAIFTFVLRGTSVLFWVVVWPYELLRYHSSSIYIFIKFILKNILTVILMCLASIFVSYLYYGKLVFVQFNFFYYNTYLGWSSLCGESPFHFFFTYYLIKSFNGYTITIYYAIYVILTKKNKQKDILIERKKEMIIILIFQMIFLSTSAHKQLRFLLIQFPFLYVLAVYGFQKIPFKFRKILIFVASLLFTCFYFSFVNIYLKYNTQLVIKQILNSSNPKSVLILSGSYQIPHYASFHKNDINITVPYIGFEVVSNSISAQQYAKQYPQEYFQEYLRHNEAPSHIIILKQAVIRKQISLNQTDKKYRLLNSINSPAMQNLDRAFNIYQLINQN